MKLFEHQIEVLEKTKDFNKCAYYLDMGLGKTFVGSEKMMSFKTSINLVICQKSKIEDWIKHFEDNYEVLVYNLTENEKLKTYLAYHYLFNESGYPVKYPIVGIINYDLVFRRKDLLNLKDFTLMLDESSLIQNEKAKRSKFILKLNAKNVILLSGTPSSGKYENLWTQIHLLGWDIKQSVYNKQYINWEKLDVGGVPIWVVDKKEPYKNVKRLKEKLRQHGAIFKKTEECFNLPEQIDIPIYIKPPNEYKTFKDNGIVTIDNDELVGDTNLTKILYARQICSLYNQNKLDAFEDLLESTNDRLIVFYNFIQEKEKLKEIIEKHERPISEVNGQVKDLKNYEEQDNSITLIQYQSGSMGLNLQKANKIIYFSLTQSSDLYEQSKKRIHRIGQNQTCFYYLLLCKNSIEDKGILPRLTMRKDFDDELFREEIW